MMLNFVRALVKGGFADLHHPEYFDLDWVQHSPLRDEYRRMVQTIKDSLHSWRTCWECERAIPTGSISSPRTKRCTWATRPRRPGRVPRRPGYFNLLTHFPWVGLRTNDPDGAHIEYFRGIENPIGVKIGAGVKRDRSRAGWRLSIPSANRAV